MKLVNPKPKLSQLSDGGRSTSVDRVYMFPENKEIPPALSSAERRNIMTYLERKEEIVLKNHSIASGIIDDLINRNCEIASLSEFWKSIEDGISSILQTDNDDEEESIIPKNLFLERINFYHEAILASFIENIASIPPSFGDERGEDEIDIQTILRVLLDEHISSDNRVSYLHAFNYLLDSSGRRDWIESKYNRSNSNRSLQMLLIVPANRGLLDSTIWLMALDNSSVYKIENGQFDGFTNEDLKKIGDFVSEIPYFELSSNKSFIQSSKSHLSIKGFYEKLHDPFGNDTPLSKYIKFPGLNKISYRELIDPKIIVNCTGDADEVQRLLDAYAREHPGEPIGYLAYEAFKKVFERDLTKVHEVDSGRAKHSETGSPLPSLPPETYQGLRGPETPPDFVKRVYSEWLGHGLTRAHFRKLDPKLYTAIDNWLSRPGNEWPADVDLPTKAEQNTRDIAALTEGEGAEGLGKFTGKEAARLAQALYRRSK